MGSLGFLTNHLYRSYKQDVRNLINGAESLGQCQLPDENVRFWLQLSHMHAA